MLNYHSPALYLLKRKSLRIYINNELGDLERGLDAALESLEVGGRLVECADQRVDVVLVVGREVKPASARQMECVCVCHQFLDLFEQKWNEKRKEEGIWTCY